MGEPPEGALPAAVPGHHGVLGDRHLQREQQRVRIYLAAIFGVLGFVWVKLGFSPTPMLLGFVLGPLMEEHLRRAMLMARGDVSVFVTRPISLGFIVATALMLSRRRRRRRCVKGKIKLNRFAR